VNEKLSLVNNSCYGTANGEVILSSKNADKKIIEVRDMANKTKRKMTASFKRVKRPQSVTARNSGK